MIYENVSCATLDEKYKTTNAVVKQYTAKINEIPRSQ